VISVSMMFPPSSFDPKAHMHRRLHSSRSLG
jgi:hypothetical protein